MRRALASLVVALLLVTAWARWINAQTVPVGAGSSFGGGQIPNPLILPDGTCTNPALRFAGDADSGLALVGSVIVVCVNGATRATFNQGNLTLSGANFYGTGSTTFAALSLTANGSIVYCSDCTQANPTAGGGSGALVVRVAGANVGLPTAAGVGSGTVTNVSVSNTQEFVVTSPTTTPEIARTAVNAAGTTGGALSVDWNSGVAYSVTLNAASTFTFLNPVSNSFYFMKVTNNGAASHVITWPASVTWANGGVTPAPSAPGKTDQYSFYYDGTTYFGRQLGGSYQTASMTQTSTVQLGAATPTDANSYGFLGGRLITDGADYSSTTTAAIATLTTANIPAGFFSRAGACVEIDYVFEPAANANSKIFRVAIGPAPTTIITQTSGINALPVVGRVNVCRAASNAQKGWGSHVTAGGTTDGELVAASLTETNEQTIHFQAQNTASRDVILRGYTIRLWN